MSVVVVGLNHHTVPLGLLESAAVAEPELPKALGDLTSRAHLGEVVLLSTCMRTEVYAVAERYHGAVSDIRTFLADWSGRPPDDFADHLYDFFDEAAVRHLLRVASGLDSAVLGEGEILRQVRTAWEVATAEGAARSGIGRVFRHAVETGKRVRTDTGIARGTTSLSHTAVSLAGSVGVPLSAMPPEARECPVVGDVPTSHGRAGVPHGAVPAAAGWARVVEGAVPAAAGEATGSPCEWAELLAGRTALVLGAGEMGGAVAELIAASPDAGPLLVASRSTGRAAALAGRLGATAVAWDQRLAALAGADIVMSATTAPGLVLTAADVAAARPGDRLLVVVDMAVPRDVEPAVGDLPGVTLFDMTDLKAHAGAAIEHRRLEVPRAEAIVAEEVERFRQATAERALAPLVAALHRRGEAVREAELARAEGRLAGLDERQRSAVEAVTRGIVNKLLHDPTANLKAAAGGERAVELASALVELFALDTEDEPGRSAS